MYRYFITRLEEKQSLIDKRPADTLVQIIFGLLTDSNDNNIEEEHSLKMMIRGGPTQDCFPDDRKQR